MRNKIELDKNLGRALKAVDHVCKTSHLELFATLATEPDDTVPMSKSLLILSTPRCGSTLFCEALNSSGEFGIAEEWFNYDYFAAWAEIMDKPFVLTEYVDFLQRKTLRGTGVFVLNWHVGQLIDMNQNYKLGIESMDFDKIVYLYRRDKVAQAVSLCKAVTTDQYRSYEEQQSPPNITLQGITSALNSIVSHDQFARGYLWKYIEEQYAYEDFCRLGSDSTRPFEGYAEVIEALGGRAKYSYSAGNLKKQRSPYENQPAAFLKYITGE